MASKTPFTTPSTSIAFRSNSGGLNSTASPTSLQDNESSDLQNVDFNKFGAVKKRAGYTALNTSAFNSGAAWNSLHWLELSSGTDFLIGTCGNKIAKMDDLDGTWDDITGAVTVTAGNNNHTIWATHLNTALGTNGVDAPFQWAGSGNAAAMTVPATLTVAKYVAVFQGYTILANVTVGGTVYTSRVYWSALDSISTWDSADFRDVGFNDGEDITGITVLGNLLVIFKTRSIWVAGFTGDADIPFTVEKTRSYVGCTAGESIAEIDNGLVFMSDDGIYFFDGNNSFKMSDKINTTLGTFEKGRFNECVASYNGKLNRYIASYTTSGGSTHNRNITWDNFNNAFSLYKGINANCFARVFVNGDERTYAGDYSGYVYRMDTGTNDYPANSVTAIDAYYYTKWFDYGDMVLKKALPILKIYYQYNEATLNFVYSYNFEAADQYTQLFSMSGGSSVYGTALYGTGTYAASGGAIKERNLTGRGEVVRLGFKNSQLSETFTLDGFGAYPYGETDV